MKDPQERQLLLVLGTATGQILLSSETEVIASMGESGWFLFSINMFGCH